MLLLQRRKKNLCYAGLALCAVYMICHFMYWYDDRRFTALRPLYDAQNEAKRLLKFMTAYHYQCNSTVQLGNRSYWPVCTEPDGNVNLDGKESILAYSVGPSDDLIFERNLVQNYSSQLVIVHHDRHFMDLGRALNNTRIINTQLTANDFADFSRNSFGQSTINAVLERFGHRRLDMLKLEFVPGDVSLWEIIHFMIMDHLLQNVKQVYIAVTVDKLEDDYLYSWYRALYDLFYREGFRLYHTQASNPLCLQVTMMQSCIYYLSWIRNPGLASFVMHPPADFGTSPLERSRLMTYLNHHVSPDLCDKLMRISDSTAQFSYCQSLLHKQTPKSCSALVISSEHAELWLRALSEDGCSVFTFTLPTAAVTDTWDVTHNHFRANRHTPGQTSKQSRHQLSFIDIEQRITSSKDVSILVLDLADYGWTALSHLLDHDALMPVSQFILTILIDDRGDGLHQVALRRKFSELQRVEAHGFRLVSGKTSATPSGHVYRLSYVRTSRPGTSA